MAILYESANNKGLLIYTQDNQIILRQKKENQFSQPFVLSHDYSHGLSDVLFNSTLYYSFIDKQGNLVIQSLFEHILPFVIEKNRNVNYRNSKLIVFAGQLVLFYCMHSLEENIYTINYLLPYHSSESCVLPYYYHQTPQYQLCQSNQDILLLLQGDHQTVMLAIDKDFSFSPLMKPSSLLETSLKQELEQYRTDISEKETHYQSLKKSYDDLQKKYDLCQKNIDHKNKQLQSVVKQYQELMHVAEEYRKEAIRWNKRYLGERL